MNRDLNKRLQKEHLDILVRNGGFEFIDSFLIYTNGEIGPFYVNVESVTKNGSDYRLVCEDLSMLVSDVAVIQGITDHMISGGERKDFLLSLPVAAKLGKKPIMIFKDKKILGADMRGGYIIHVADVNRAGSSMRDSWVPVIREAGGTIEHAFFYVDRLEGGVQVMEDLGIKSHARIRLDEHAWDYLIQQEALTPELYKSIMERRKDPDRWAREMLRSEKGIARLVDLLEDPDNHLKIRKVLDKGYSNMKQEVLFLLKESGVSNKIIRSLR